MRFLLPSIVCLVGPSSADGFEKGASSSVLPKQGGPSNSSEGAVESLRARVAQFDDRRLLREMGSGESLTTETELCGGSDSASSCEVSGAVRRLQTTDGSCRLQGHPFFAELHRNSPSPGTIQNGQTDWSVSMGSCVEGYFAASSYQPSTYSLRCRDGALEFRYSFYNEYAKCLKDEICQVRGNPVFGEFGFDSRDVGLTVLRRSETHNQWSSRQEGGFRCVDGRFRKYYSSDTQFSLGLRCQEGGILEISDFYGRCDPVKPLNAVPVCKPFGHPLFPALHLDPTGMSRDVTLSESQAEKSFSVKCQEGFRVESGLSNTQVQLTLKCREGPSDLIVTAVKGSCVPHVRLPGSVKEDHEKLVLLTSIALGVVGFLMLLLFPLMLLVLCTLTRLRRHTLKQNQVKTGGEEGGEGVPTEDREGEENTDSRLRTGQGTPEAPSPRVTQQPGEPSHREKQDGYAHDSSVSVQHGGMGGLGVHVFSGDPTREGEGDRRGGGAHAEPSAPPLKGYQGS
uniref:Sushi domain-containing protein n=1 Tax=Chromera velia CCMP2878 TaxID=1169474 RepID=A0A0G4FVZ0_9ALVE|eukprot:Cvel_19048.t1-p1 / transcript=Cvel_19048.t1 / gene=Cvel_19048 / organism=Chromera_velia_CCMP2878 / gene_product=hypothetical protein / transcript_product=hypothetical protein / location=Cvel_scaffold1615:10429-12576(-) / protein_length=510 / sequence_SO=supercontig / SO=protein_coding / is_pseudo=false